MSLEVLQERKGNILIRLPSSGCKMLPNTGRDIARNFRLQQKTVHLSSNFSTGPMQNKTFLRNVRIISKGPQGQLATTRTPSAQHLQGFFQQSHRRADAETAVKVAGATAKHSVVLHGKIYLPQRNLEWQRLYLRFPLGILHCHMQRWSNQHHGCTPHLQTLSRFANFFSPFTTQ